MKKNTRTTLKALGALGALTLMAALVGFTGVGGFAGFATTSTAPTASLLAATPASSSSAPSAAVTPPSSLILKSIFTGYTPSRDIAMPSTQILTFTDKLPASQQVTWRHICQEATALGGCTGYARYWVGPSGSGRDVIIVVLQFVHNSLATNAFAIVRESAPVGQTHMHDFTIAAIPGSFGITGVGTGPPATHDVEMGFPVGGALFLLNASAVSPYTPFSLAQAESLARTQYDHAATLLGIHVAHQQPPRALPGANVVTTSHKKLYIIIGAAVVVVLLLLLILLMVRRRRRGSSQAGAESGLGAPLGAGPMNPLGGAGPMNPVGAGAAPGQGAAGAVAGNIPAFGQSAGQPSTGQAASTAGQAAGEAGPAGEARPEAQNPALPPANWYPDPTAPPGSDRLRYWDGKAWTQHIHPPA